MSKKNKKEDIKEEQTEAQEVEVISVEEQLQEDLQKEKDKFLRLFAEFENYKKRTTKERIELFTTASQDVMVSLLPILDDFDRAHSEISKSNDKELLKGVELIGNKFKDILKSKGLAEVEVKQGDVFNADDHEAITQIPAPSKKLKGKIIDVIEKGYALGDKVIRFPKVVIGQ
jgi:molecular chaperone GrpE